MVIHNNKIRVYSLLRFLNQDDDDAWTLSMHQLFPGSRDMARLLTQLLKIARAKRCSDLWTKYKRRGRAHYEDFLQIKNNKLFFRVEPGTDLTLNTVIIMLAKTVFSVWSVEGQFLEQTNVTGLNHQATV